MGIWLEGPRTEAQEERARRLFDERLPGFVFLMGDCDGYWAISSLTRYWGPGYERGPWPTIFAAIMLAQFAFPDCRVHYSSDETWPGEGASPFTSETAEEYWRHWASDSGDDRRG